MNRLIVIVVLLVVAAVVVVAETEYVGPGLGVTITSYSIDDTIRYHRTWTYRSGIDNQYLTTLRARFGFRDSAIVEGGLYYASDSTLIASTRPCTLRSSSGKAAEDTVDLVFSEVLDLENYQDTGVLVCYVAFWGTPRPGAAGPPGIGIRSSGVGDSNTHRSGTISYVETSVDTMFGLDGAESGTWTSGTFAWCNIDADNMYTADDGDYIDTIYVMGYGVRSDAVIDVGIYNTSAGSPTTRLSYKSVTLPDSAVVHDTTWIKLATNIALVDGATYTYGCGTGDSKPSREVRFADSSGAGDVVAVSGSYQLPSNFGISTVDSMALPMLVRFHVSNSNNGSVIWPTTLTRAATSPAGSRCMTYLLGLADEYGAVTDWQWDIQGEADTAAWIVATAEFSAAARDLHESTLVSMAIITEPPAANLALSTPDTSEIFEHTIGYGEDDVCSLWVALSPGDHIVVQAIDFRSDSTADTADAELWRMPYADSFTVSLIEGMYRGQTTDATILEVIKTYTYMDTPDLRVMNGAKSNDERVVVRFDSALVDIPKYSHILSAKLVLTAQHDTTHLWWDSIPVCVGLLRDTIGEAFSYSTAGAPTWNRRTASSAWSDTGAVNRSIREQGAFCTWVTTTANAEYQIDVTHLVAFAWYHRLPMAFVVYSGGEDANFRYRRAFWSSDYMADMGKRVRLDISATTAELPLPPQYARGPLGVDVAHDSMGVSTAHGGFRE